MLVGYFGKDPPRERDPHSSGARAAPAQVVTAARGPLRTTLCPESYQRLASPVVKVHSKCNDSVPRVASMVTRYAVFAASGVSV